MNACKSVKGILRYFLSTNLFCKCLIREFQRKLWRGAVTGGFGLFSAKQSAALVNAIKTKMTAKRLSYTAALVEVAANRLLKQEDELEKFNLRVEKRGETKEPVSHRYNKKKGEELDVP